MGTLTCYAARMKREKRQTKKEKKAARPQVATSGRDQGEEHIHCIACGRHLDPSEFDDPKTATIVTCEHKSSFPSCVGCVTPAKALLAEHDRTGKPVKTAGAYH